MNRDTLLNKLNNWYAPASTALGATAIAIVMTRLVLGISAIENNPITALGLETTGSWQLIGLGSIAGLAGLLYGLKHIESRYPDYARIPRAGTWTIATISVGDVALNTQHLLTNGLPESFLVGELAELGLLLTGASVIALGAIKFDRELLSATAQFGRASRSVGRPQTMAIMFCILVVGSMVGPHVGFSGPVGTASAASSGSSAIYVASGVSGSGGAYHLNPSLGTAWSDSSLGAQQNAVGYSENYVYTASASGDIRQYDKNGNLQQTIAVASALESGDADSNGNFYVGDGGTDIYKYNSDGTQEWSATLDGSPLAVEVGDDGVYAIDQYGNLYKYSLDGTKDYQVTYNLQDIEYTDGKLIGGTSDPAVKEIDPADGSEIWSYAHSTDNIKSVDYNADEGAVYAGDAAGEVLKISDGSLLDSRSLTSSSIDAMEVEDGKVYAGSGDVYKLSTDLSTDATQSVSGDVRGFASEGLSQSVTGTVTSCDATTYASDKSNCEDTPVPNAQGQVVAVQKSALSPEDGETYEEAAQEALEQARNPLPDSWDSDLQLTGSDGYFRSVEGEYVAVHSPGEWGMAGWSEGADLSSPQLNPRANERIVLSAWDTSKDGMLQDSANSDLYGATVKRDIVVKRLDPAGDVIDSQTLSPNKEVTYGDYGIAGTWGNTHHVVETSLQAGVYRVHPDGSPESAYTIVVGDADQIARTIESDLRDRSDALSEQAKNIQAKVDDGTFVVKNFETDSNGDYSVEVPADTVSVHVQAYRMDGETLTTIENPSIQDMRDEVGNTDYNGSISISPGPETYSVPSEAGSADATVIKFSSPPKQGLDDFLASWEEFRDKLQNNSLSDASSIFTDSFDLTKEELEDRKDEAGNVANGNEEVEERYNEILQEQRDTNENLEDSITDIEGSNEELREEIAALEQAISETGSTVEAGEPTSSIDTGGENATATFRQAFDADLSEDDVLVVWKDTDGSSTTIPEEYWSVDSSLVGDDEVVVEEYPVPENSAGGHISVSAVSDTEVAKGGDHVTNPDFDGDMPDIRSVDASSLRPGVGESVSMTPRLDSAGHSLQSATVYDPVGNTVTSSVTDGTIEFTPSTQGAHTVRYTLVDNSGNEFVETAKISAQESSNAWPASVRAVEGTSGTYALAGDELRDANVEVKDNGNTVEVTALVPEDSTPSEVHVYLDEAGINADGDIEVRVLQGSNIDTASSVDTRVGVTLHTQRLEDNAAVYRSGGLDGGNTPIPVGSSSTGGERAQKADHTSIQTYTDESGRASVAVNNDPSWIDRRTYEVDVWLDGINLPVLTASVPPVPLGALADTASVAGAATAPLDGLTATTGVSA